MTQSLPNDMGRVVQQPVQASGGSPASATQVFPPAPPCPNGFIYTVQSGDSMFSIAQRFGVSLQALIAANPQISDPSVIFPGQQICVPTGVAPPPPPPCPNGFIYTVQSGDSMFSIAQRFGVSLQALIAANPQITNPSVIFPGQQICVPRVPPPLFWCVAPLTGTNIASTSAGAAFVRRAQGDAFVVGINMPPLPGIGTQYVAFFMNTPTNTGLGFPMAKFEGVDEVFAVQAQNAALADKDFVIVSREPVTPIGPRPTGPVIIDGSIAQCP